jgi:hypothetical protein
MLFEKPEGIKNQPTEKDMNIIENFDVFYVHHQIFFW